MHELYSSNSRCVPTHLLDSRGDWSALVASRSTEKYQTQIHTSSRSKLAIRATRNSHRPNFQVNVFQEDLTNPNIALNLQNRSRPNAFVPMPLGFASVVIAEVVSSFQKTKPLNEWESRMNVSSCGLLLVSLPLLVRCCCLLSRESGMIVQSLSWWLARKSYQRTVHQEQTITTRHGKGNNSLSLHSLVKRNRST